MTPDELKQAGFSDIEVKQYSDLSSAGFSDDEIATHLSGNSAVSVAPAPKSDMFSEYDKNSVFPRASSEARRLALEAGGSTVGALVGAPLGVPGAMAGGGLGYAGGKLTADYLDELSGTRESPDLLGRVADVGKDFSIGALLQGSGESAVSALRGAVEWGKRRLAKSGIALTKEDVLLKAKEILQSNVSKVPADPSIPAESERLAAEIPGYKPSLAEGSGDVDLIRLQQSLARQPGGMSTEVAHRQANREALSRYLENAFPGSGNIDDVIAQIQKNSEATATATKKAGETVTATKNRLPVVDKQQTGVDAVSAIEAQRIPAKKTVGQMYKDLPDDPILPENTQKAVDALESDFRPGDEDVFPSRAISRIKEAINPPKDAKVPKGGLRDVADEINDVLPVNQALSTIRESGGISLSSLQKKYSETQISELMKARPGMVSSTGKGNLEQIAADHGFGSGDELLSSIMDAKPKAGLSRDLAQQNELFIKEGASKEKFTPGFQDLHSLRKDIGRQAYDAMTGAKPNRELAMKLNRLKDAIDADIESVMFPNNDYAAAREAYSEYAKRFRSGAVEQVLRRGNQASGRAVPDALIPAKLFTPDGADDLIRAIGKKDAAIVMEGHAANDLLAKATNATTGELNTTSLNSWIAKNKVVLDKFGITDNFTSLSRAQATLDAAKQAETAYGKSVASKILNADPEKAISVAMSGAGGRNTGETMQQLVDQVKDNPAALTGLKNSFKDFMVKTAQNTADAITGGQVISNTKIQKALEKYDPAMKVLYGEKSKEYAALRNVQKAVETSYRSIPSPLGGGSNTVEQANTALDTLAKVVGMPGLKMGPAGSFLVRVAQKGLSVFTKISEQDVTAVLRRAMYDPELAKDLLMAKHGLNPVAVSRNLGAKLLSMGIMVPMQAGQNGRPAMKNETPATYLKNLIGN